MSSPELLAYIQQQRSAGVPDSEIRRSLIISNWPIPDVDSAMTSTPAPLQTKGGHLLTNLILGFLVIVFVEAALYTWSNQQLHSELASSPFASSTGFVPEALTPINYSDYIGINPVSYSRTYQGSYSGGTSYSNSTSQSTPSLSQTLAQELTTIVDGLTGQQQGGGGNGGGGGGGGAPAPTCTFTASPTTITSGQSSTLTWTTSNVTSIVITPSIGASTLSGSQTVSPTLTAQYSLQATGPGGSITCNTQVIVQAGSGGGGGGGGSNPRLTVSGSQILDPSGNPIILRGFNWGDWGSPLPHDAADNIAQGANYVRIPLSWYFGSGTGATDCKTGQDSYDLQSPQTGYINPTNLAAVDQEVAWATSAHLWVNLMVRGGDCDFWTNPSIIPQYIQMWQFLANRYKNTPYIGSYEILSEPHPPVTGRTHLPNEALIKSLAEQNIASIRAIDPVTPIVVGPGQVYDIRNISTMYLSGIPNIIYTANFFELPTYVKSEKGKGPDNGYPNSYLDSELSSSYACTYPNEGNGNNVQMDKTWLAGLLTCVTNFRSQYNVPVYINQIGIFTSTKNAQQYTQDVLGLFDQNGISWTWWTYRQRPAASDPNTQAIIYKDTNGVWQTKQDWLSLISSFF